MSALIEQLQDVEINAELADAEITAIDNLKTLDETGKKDFMASLKSGTINVDGTEMKMDDIITKFNDNIERDALNGKYVAKAEKTLDARLTALITDTDKNDLVYMVSTINFIENESIVTSKVSDSLKTHMNTLKATLVWSSESGLDLSVDTSSITATDITFNMYSGITAGDIVAAVEKLKALLWKEPLESGKTIDDIIKMIKEGKILDLQQALGMSVDGKNVSEKADGLFGMRTLKNLEAGKVVKMKYATWGDGTKWWTITAWNDTGTDTSTAVDSGKTIEIAKKVHKIYTIKDISALPAEAWDKEGKDVEPKVYQIEIVYNGVKGTLNFFGNGRVAIYKTNIMGNRTDYLKKWSTGKREWKEAITNTINAIRVSKEDYDKLPQDFSNNPKRDGDPKSYVVKVEDIASDYAYFTFFGNGRVKKTKKGGTSFDMDYSKNIIKKLKAVTATTTTTTPEVVEKSSNTSPLISEMYDPLTDEIEKIAVSEFIDAYKSENPWIASCFYGKSFVTINEKNPYFQIKYRNNKSYTADNAQTKPISLRDCMDAKGNLDKQKLFANIFEEIQPTILLMDQKEKNDKILASVRGKTYTQQELFGNKYDGDSYFSTYFELFSDNKVMVDASPTYTYISPDGKRLHFDLNDSGRDEDYNKNWETKIEDMTDDEGNYDESKFKAAIVRIIERIVTEYIK